MSHLRSRLRRATVALARTTLGTRLVHSILFDDADFDHVREWPAGIEGFEDLAFLFAQGHMTMGTAMLRIGEGAYLYRLARGLPLGAVAVEIGRFRGGSTFLLAAALQDRGEVYSYELPRPPQEELDAALHAALRRYGLDRHTHLIPGDSRSAEPPPRRCDLVFVDGDHSYVGARADYERWRCFLVPGGHLLFHDSEAGGAAAVVAEIECDDAAFFAARGCIASLAHLTRTDEPAPWDR